MKDFQVIVDEINDKASNYNIGSLFAFRKNLGKGARKRLFQIEDRMIENGFTFHWGGRTELQFNIGVSEKEKYLRYGVAFSFENNQWYPDIVTKLKPKVVLFNEYINSHSNELLDLKMWYHDNDNDGVKSHDFLPCAIPNKLITDKMFVFLGQRQDIDSIDYQKVLSTLDRLLPLYEFIEKKSYKSSASNK